MQCAEVFPTVETYRRNGVECLQPNLPLRSLPSILARTLRPRAGEFAVRRAELRRLSLC